MKRVSAAIVVLAMTTQLGCSAFQDPTWDKPFGWGTWGSAIVCAAIGAGIGVAIQDSRTFEATGPGGARSESHAPLWQGAAVGAPVGAVVCGLLGHLFLDKPEEEVTPVPLPTVTPTPEPTPEPLVVSRRIVLRGINFFDFDKSEIQSQSYPVLDEAAQILQQYPDVNIVVEGYTDDIGSEEYNMQLSIRRAEAVFRYLVNRGVAPERVRVEGFGESRPVADNATPEGRAENRRVEIRMTTP